MPRVVMKRHAPLLLAWFVLPIATASAQYTSTKISSVKLGTKTQASGETTPIYVNAKDCDDNVAVVVKLQSLPAAGFLEVWRDNSDDCHADAGRTLKSGATELPCTRIGDSIMAPGATQSLSFKVLELFSSNGKKCDQSGAQKVYFVPVMTETPDNASSGVSAGIGDAIIVTFTVDVDAPNAPTKVSAADGENEIGLSWDSDDDSAAANGFRIYYDPNGISKMGSDCTSELLVAEKAPPDPDELETSDEARGVTKTTRSPSSLGLNVGEQIPAAVVALDKAGNESRLSEVVCIQRVETDGFLDRYEDQGGKGLDKCSVHAPGRVGWGSLGCLTVLGLTLVSRRRRTA